jgi:hypothetical protein
LGFVIDGCAEVEILTSDPLLLLEAASDTTAMVVRRLRVHFGKEH